MKKNLFLLTLMALAVCPLLGEEEAAAPKEIGIQFTESSVTPDYLTAKADSDAIDVGVVEIVAENGEAAAEDDCEEDEEEENELSFLAGPAEIATSVAIPLAFTGIGISCGVLPASEGYGGMAVTPLTTTIGAGIGAVCGAVFTPFLALKGVFDTFTLGAFTDTDFDIDDHTVIMEDQIDNVNDIFLLNNPFEEDEAEDGEDGEDEEEEEDSEESAEDSGEETAEEQAN